MQKKKFPKDKALENFDDFYGSVYGNRWKSIRAALLSPHKYVALVNNFGDTEETIASLEAEGAINVRLIYNVAKENLETKRLNFLNTTNEQTTEMDRKLSNILQKQKYDEIAAVYPKNSEYVDSLMDADTESSDESNIKHVDYKKSLGKTIEEDSDLDYRRMIDDSVGAAGLHEYIPATKLKGKEDWVLESDHYNYYNTTTDFPLTVEMETELTFPENLHIFTYEKGNISTFIKPQRSVTGVSSHYMMNGSSILPPLALNIQPGERVLDACAAPGGKSLMMLQTLYPSVLVCNDIQESRVNRIHKTLREYIFDFEDKWNRKRCALTQEDARAIGEYGMYDKILVDVPCTTDRRAVLGNENNIFKPTRIKERLRLPEMQASILTNCIKLLKPGGSLVYATCSLSPVQNDGVVHMALSNAFRDDNITATIKYFFYI